MISPEQRAARRNYVGSSDAPAVLGLSPFRNASDVYLEKIGVLDESKETDVMRRGTWLEPALLMYAKEEHGLEFERDKMIIHPSNLLAANLDGLGTEIIIEAKSSNMIEGWGEEGTDEVPEHVLIQTHHQFAVCGPKYRVAYIPVILPVYSRLTFRMYVVERKNELVDFVEQAGIEFMQKHVQPQLPPADFKPAKEIARMIKREEGKKIILPDAVANFLELARKRAKEAEDEKDRIEGEVMAAMGDAEIAVCGEREITCFMQNQRRASTELIRTHAPELFEKLTKESSFRVLRTRKAK